MSTKGHILTRSQIYGLFKFLTDTPEPTASRPSIFSPFERAKYDAWKSIGVEYSKKGGAAKDEAEARYLEIAKDLGWIPGKPKETGLSSSLRGETSEEPTAEELLEREDAENKIARPREMLSGRLRWVIG